jgi:hypothetical protein
MEEERMSRGATNYGSMERRQGRSTQCEGKQMFLAVLFSSAARLMYCGNMIAYIRVYVIDIEC